MFGSYGRPLLIITLVLATPVVPFVLFGDRLEAWFTSIFDPPPSAQTLWWLVVGVMASDVLLPVPSSMVSTLAGAQLGIVGGTSAAWLGMTAGAVAAFGLARRFGRPLALKLVAAEDLDRLDRMAARLGPGLIVLTRAVPVLAEASVLLLGVNQLAWRRLLPALAASNLGIALAYAAFGELAGRHAWLPLALGISLAAPLALLAIAKWVLSRRTKSNAVTNATVPPNRD